MTKELATEQLCPFFPYKLKMMWSDGDIVIVSPHVHERDYGTDEIPVFSALSAVVSQNAEGEPVLKPIFRPLTDIMKEIVHAGQVFSPYESLKAAVGEEHWGKIAGTIVTATDNPLISDMPYWCVRALLQWHFDLFGWIKQSRAVNINTLQ